MAWTTVLGYTHATVLLRKKVYTGDQPVSYWGPDLRPSWHMLAQFFSTTTIAGSARDSRASPILSRGAGWTRSGCSLIEELGSSQSFSVPAIDQMRCSGYCSVIRGTVVEVDSYHWRER